MYIIASVLVLWILFLFSVFNFRLHLCKTNSSESRMEIESWRKKRNFGVWCRTLPKHTHHPHLSSTNHLTHCHICNFFRAKWLRSLFVSRSISHQGRIENIRLRLYFFSSFSSSHLCVFNCCLGTRKSRSFCLHLILIFLCCSFTHCIHVSHSPPYSICQPKIFFFFIFL